MIPYGRQSISQSDIDAVTEVLQSNFLTQGPAVPLFEKLVSDYCGAQFSVAVNSATSALHIACLALDLGPGDWLWTSPNTFVASANVGLYCGANVDFVDIDPRTYNMCPGALERKLKYAEGQGTLPKIVIPVHYAGQPCEMSDIKVLSDRYGFSIIEDASHAIGASYSGSPVGSCLYGDITVFSFHPVKIITSGEGGMALTNHQELAERMTRLRSHGTTTNPEVMAYRDEQEIWNYQQVELGFNYRLTDVQAALGSSQMAQLDAFVARRRSIASRYHAELADLPLILPHQSEGCVSSYHLYPIRVGVGPTDKSQREIYDGLRCSGIAANLHYIPVHRQPYYESLGFSVGDFPEAEKFHREAISLPIFPALTSSEQDYVIQSIRGLCH